MAMFKIYFKVNQTSEKKNLKTNDFMIIVHD